MEHPQSMINLALMGKRKTRNLEQLLIKSLTHVKMAVVFIPLHVSGGYVNASEPEMLAVNEDELSGCGTAARKQCADRIGDLADFPEEGPLGGVAFQRSLERAAWKAGNGKVPAQLFEDYQNHKPSTRLKDVEPCIMGDCVQVMCAVFFQKRSEIP